MKPISIHRGMRATALVLGAVMLAGCAVFTAATPEQAVERRAAEYWKARGSGQYEAAYAFTTPSYRKLHTPEQFKMQFGSGASIQGAEVANVTCEPQKCTVRMKLNVKPALMSLNVGTVATYLNETWLLEDGQWWRYEE